MSYLTSIKKKCNKFLFFVALVLLTVSCASSTMINSVPQGAKVVIDGQSVGTTPYLYVDTKILGSVTTIDLLKDGYEPLYTTIRRSEEFNLGTFIGGCFIWPVWLWTLDYKSQHTWELMPLAPTSNSPAATMHATPAIGNSKLEQLREIKLMLDEKLITDEEFSVQKQKILDAN